jgi:4-amino-4-deoxy-L-arabinose transferase-like glycosyltransferase
MLAVLLSGGLDTVVLGVRVRANQPSDAVIIAAGSLLFFFWQRYRAPDAARRPIRQRLAAAFARLKSADTALLATVLFAAAVARFWGLTFGLPHPAARPDEEAVSAIASGFYYGNFRPPIFDYPPLFMLLVAGTWWVLFAEAPSLAARMNLHIQWPALSMSAERIVARALSALSGVASVWLLFRVAARLFGRQTALVAAAFLSLAFLHVRDSHFGVTDVPMTAMVLAAFLAVLGLADSGSARNLAGAGVLIGLAVATKYNAALLVLPAAMAILDDPLKRPVSQRLVRVAALSATVAVVFILVSPWAMLDFERFLSDAAGVSRHLSRGHGVDLGRGWTYHVRTTLRHGLGWPLLVTGIAGLPLMVWRERSRGLLVALFPMAYYVVMGSGRTVFARYALPLVPFLCLTAAYAVSAAADWAAARMNRQRWSGAVAVLLTSGVLWPSAQSVLAFDRLLVREDSRVAARRWIEARFPAGTTIGEIGAANAHLYFADEQHYVAMPAVDRPELISIVSSPVTGAAVEDVAPWLTREYDLAFSESVVAEDDPENIYDRQDEFYVPLAGFHDIERPGPNVRVFVRRDNAR